MVEAFINADPSDLRHYAEYQVAPTNERLDLRLRLPDRDFAWQSGFASAVDIDTSAKVWRSSWHPHVRPQPHRSASGNALATEPLPV